MSYQYQTPQKYFYTPSPDKYKNIAAKNDPQVEQITAADQYLTRERSIIENNKYKLRSLLAQKNRLLRNQPYTPQFSPISKYSLRQSESGITKPNKFSLDTDIKQASEVKTQYINDDLQVSKNKINEYENQDEISILKKISNRVKGIIKNQSSRKNPVYFSRNSDSDINNQVRNLVQQNTVLRSQVQQFQITDNQKSKKIQQLTQQLKELNKLYKQKEQNHHTFVQIKNTQMQNIQRHYRFQIKSITQMFEDSLKQIGKNTISKMEQISIKNVKLNKKIIKLQQNTSVFKEKFKVERQIFHDVTHRKVKNLSEISPGIQGDIELEDQQKQKLEFQQQIQRQKSQLQKELDEYESKYQQLQKGFFEMKSKNMLLIKELQSMKATEHIPFIQENKILQNIEIQTENIELEQPKKVDQHCNTIKLDIVDGQKQKYVKSLQQEISKVRDQLQMLSKYFSQQMEKNQTKQQNFNQSLIESFRKKPNSKQLAMIENLAKKQRKQKNIAYIKLASLQKELQSEKKKNKIYEEELISQVEQEQVAEQFTLEQKIKLNMPDGYAGLQWQKVVRQKLKSVLQQIRHIQANQKSGR